MTLVDYPRPRPCRVSENAANCPEAIRTPAADPAHPGKVSQRTTTAGDGPIRGEPPEVSRGLPPEGLNALPLFPKQVIPPEGQIYYGRSEIAKFSRIEHALESKRGKARRPTGLIRSKATVLKHQNIKRRRVDLSSAFTLV